MKKSWTVEEIELLIAFVSLGYSRLEISNELDRSVYSIQKKLGRLNIAREYKVLSNTEYLNKLLKINPTIIAVENFISICTPILHKCLACENEYKVSPQSKLRGRGCKYCDTPGGIRLDKPGVTYLVYDKERKLFKIGITGKNLIDRMKDIGIKNYEILVVRKFNTGKEARDLERQWLFSVKGFKLNTGLLKNGNTETFKYDI